MRKEDKSTIIEQIAATVKEYGHFYLVDVTAMNAAATSCIEKSIVLNADIKLMVVKNTLLHKALESSGRRLLTSLRFFERYYCCYV